MKLEMSFKKIVVGGLKIWKYFRTRFRGTSTPREIGQRSDACFYKGTVFFGAVGRISLGGSTPLSRDPKVLLLTPQKPGELQLPVYG